MSNTLSLIEDLERSLNTKASVEEAEAWWAKVLLIESRLNLDQRRTKDELRLMKQLRNTVTDAIVQIRDKWPSPNFSSALIAANTLKGCIEHRSIGADGWPVRGK